MFRVSSFVTRHSIRASSRRLLPDIEMASAGRLCNARVCKGRMRADCSVPKQFVSAKERHTFRQESRLDLSAVGTACL